MSHANHVSPFHRHAELPLAEPFIIASQQRRVQSSVKHACPPPLPAALAAGSSPLFVAGGEGRKGRGGERKVFDYFCFAPHNYN